SGRERSASGKASSVRQAASHRSPRTSAGHGVSSAEAGAAASANGDASAESGADSDAGESAEAGASADPGAGAARPQPVSIANASDAGARCARPQAAAGWGTSSRPYMESAASLPGAGARDSSVVFAVDDAPEARKAQGVDVRATLDPDPVPAHLERDGARRAAAEERVEHPVARGGRHRENARDQLLGLLAPDEANPPLARDALEADVVPHVRQRLDDHRSAFADGNLVGQKEDAIAPAQDERLVLRALEHEDALRLASRAVDERLRVPAHGLVPGLREADHVLGVRDRVPVDLGVRGRPSQRASQVGAERSEAPRRGRLARILEPRGVRGVVANALAEHGVVPKARPVLRVHEEVVRDVDGPTVARLVAG